MRISDSAANDPSDAGVNPKPSPLEHPGISRRDFLKVTVAAAVATATGTLALAADSKNEVPRRKLGRTGAEVSIVGLGGFHIGRPSESDGIRLVRTALDNGVNFLDNSWDYHAGDSEVRMGKALRDGYRDRAFLMTKIDGRTRQAAQKQIDESLRRLQTDHLDLLQIHEIGSPDDPDRVFGPGGAIEALVESQKAGKTRFLGFTGHKSPDVHLKMLDAATAHNFRFDAVQMPLNVMDANFNSFEKKVVPVLVQQQTGVLGMKPLCFGAVLESQTATAIECLHYAMNLPTSTVITGCESMAILQQALDAARSFRPLTPDQVSALLAKTATVARTGQYEPYKTSHRFDGTYWRPEWLG
ncbi:MAG: aldo/keto reductase [Verrucomicrobiia bacterium]|jgi:aryl-alcohol dehydrogenase-like predicted oxidoreductase